MRLLGLALCAVPSLAMAQTDVVGTVSAAGGYTDNVLSVPDQPANPGDPTPEADSFGEVRPSLYINVDGKRSSHRLSYTFVTSVYMEHDEANSYLNRLDYAALFLLSPRTDLALTLGGEQGEQNSFANAAAGMVTALPSGGVNYFSASAAESLEFAINPQWRLHQGLATDSFYPSEPDVGPPQPRTFTVEHHLGLARETELDLYAADLRNNVGFTTEQADEAGMVVIPRQEVLINSLMGRWRRDLGRDWESELALGAVQVSPLRSPEVQVIEPAGQAAIRYLTDDGEAELTYAHDATVNLYVGQTYLTDGVTLRAGLPLLPEDRLAIAAIAGYQHGREFNAVAQRFTAVVDVVTVEGSVTWRPDDALWFSLRYAFFTQDGEASDATAVAPPSFLRNTILFEVSGSVGQSTPRDRRQLPGRARVGESRRDFIEGSDDGGDGGDRDRDPRTRR